MTAPSNSAEIDFDAPFLRDIGHSPAANLCQQIIKQHSKSFSFAAHFLPPSARVDASVLYAWCRRVDDAIDEVPVNDAPLALEQLQLELDAIYSPTGEPIISHDPVLVAFKSVVKRHSIPKYYPQEMLKGMEMDVNNTTYEHLQTLYQYCFRVASVVGLMMCHILKIKDDHSLENAAHLGIAMQLTNICRDVSEDWARDRLYLPRELLISSSVSGVILADLNATGVSHKPSVSNSPLSAHRFNRLDLPILMREPAREAIYNLLRLADIHYKRGYKGIGSLPFRAGYAIQAAGMIYQDIGRIIKDHQCDPNQSRAVTSKLRKVTLALVAIMLHSLKSIGRGLLSMVGSKTNSAHTPSKTLLFEDLYQNLTLVAVKDKKIEQDIV